MQSKKTMLKVFSNLGILCLEYKRSAETLSADQLQKVGAQAREVLAKHGYALLAYKSFNRLQFYITRESDGVKWLIAQYDATNQNLDGTRAAYDRAFGWLLCVSTAQNWETFGLSRGVEKYIFYTPNTYSVCPTPIFSGNSDADRLNKLVCDSLKIEADYSAVARAIQFALRIDIEQTKLIATLATNLKANWNALAYELAKVCLQKFKELRNALADTPARVPFKWPRIAVFAIGIDPDFPGLPDEVVCEATYIPQFDFKKQPYEAKFGNFLRESFLAWAHNVFAN